MISLILIFISISHVVAFNSYILFYLPLGKFITEDVLGLFRSSGSFFWPVFYILVLASFYTLKTLKYKFVILILILALSLQLYDLSNILYQRGQAFENQVFSTSILSEEFKNASQGYQHLEFYPVIPHKNYMIFAMFAAQNDISVNNGHFARPIVGQDEYLANQMEKIQAGHLDEDTIYVFSRDADMFVENLKMEDHLYIPIDNTFVLFPYYIK